MKDDFPTKAVILAGGVGSRLSEETLVRPKPLIEIGGRPILWHIMKIYSCYGVREFIICCGYKGYLIKEYFMNYCLHMSDVTFHMADNKVEMHERHAEPWTVTVVDTGDESQTAGRLKRVERYIGEEPFFFTYGDGLGTIDIKESYRWHRELGVSVTLCAVKPPGRYGAVKLANGKVLNFQEKPEGDGAWVNGGFFVCQPAILDRIPGDRVSFESDTLPKLAETAELGAFNHDGFWYAMDTLRDKNHLEALWQSGKAPWKIW